MQVEIPETARRFLQRPGLYATVATLNPDGGPHQAVIWYLLTDEGVLVNSSEDRQWPRNLRRDPRASIAVEDGEQSVTMRGRVEVIDDENQAQSDIATLARRYHADDPQQVEWLITNAFQRQRRVSFLFRPEHVHVHGLGGEEG